ncbi:MAG: flavodoxin domain-containing protein [Anaerolineaceae bacterium]|nr:flavodoxin domain-containing protein [Anaerolineaceae bacterium]
MKSLVVYDSVHGNTKTIAETVAKELGGGSRVVSVSDFNLEDLKEVKLLVVGSPIIAWQPTVKIMNFLSGFKKKQLDGFKAAVFDTRITLFIHGDAAGKIAVELARAGAVIVTEPMGFKVKGTEGPLLKGEVERAAAWARSLRVLAV